MDNFTSAIESLTLIPSGGGRFEVVVDNDLVYSKKATGRHLEEGELLRIFEEAVDVEPK